MALALSSGGGFALWTGGGSGSSGSGGEKGREREIQVEGVRRGVEGGEESDGGEEREIDLYHRDARVYPNAPCNRRDPSTPHKIHVHTCAF